MKKADVMDYCAHCGHARNEHYWLRDKEPTALLATPGSCLHRDSANGARCPCSLYCDEQHPLSQEPRP